MQKKMRGEKRELYFILDEKDLTQIYMLKAKSVFISVPLSLLFKKKISSSQSFCRNNVDSLVWRARR